MASIQQRGSRFRAVVRVAGQPPQIKTFGTRQEAEQWALGQEAALGGKKSQGGRRALPAPSAPDSGARVQGGVVTYTMTLGAALERYMAEVTPTKKGAKAETNRIALWLRDPLASRPMSSITSEDLTAWRRREEATPVRGKPRSPSTIRNKLYLLSAVFRHARSEWAMPGLPNPIPDVKKPRQRRGRDVRLSPEQRNRLWQETLRPRRAKRVGFLYYMARLAVLTAMRQGELREQAVWNAWEGRVLTLEDTKNGDRRCVPLSTEALMVISDWWEAQGQPKEGKMFPYSEAQVQRAWAWTVAVIRKNDPAFPHVTFHDLRHLAATDLSKKLSNVLELSAVTGHRSIQVLKRYYNPDPNELARKLG